MDGQARRTGTEEPETQENRTYGQVIEHECLILHHDSRPVIAITIREMVTSNGISFYYPHQEFPPGGGFPQARELYTSLEDAKRAVEIGFDELTELLDMLHAEAESHVHGPDCEPRIPVKVPWVVPGDDSVKH